MIEKCKEKYMNSYNLHGADWVEISLNESGVLPSDGAN